jgi:hypothetical protein
MPAGSWQREHPEEMVWCMAHPESTYGERFRMFGFLDIGDTSDLFSMIADSIVDGDQPAEAWAAPQIPNGDYIIKLRRGMSDIATFYYRVYTVSSGPLSGKRIVKHRHEGGIFKGFGFVTNNGGFSLWRRYASNAEADYVRVWEDAIGAIADAASQHGTGSEWAQVCFNDGITIATADTERGRLFVSMSAMHCTLCNEQWYSEYQHQSVPVPLCGDAHSIPETNLTPERYEEVRATLGDDPARMAVALALPLSELGDGSIQ